MALEGGGEECNLPALAEAKNILVRFFALVLTVF